MSLWSDDFTTRFYCLHAKDGGSSDKMPVTCNQSVLSQVFRYLISVSSFRIMYQDRVFSLPFPSNLLNCSPSWKNSKTEVLYSETVYLLFKLKSDYTEMIVIFFIQIFIMHKKMIFLARSETETFITIKKIIYK